MLVKMAAIRHLVFLKFEILTNSTVARANFRHLAKFHADRLSRCVDMAIFKMNGENLSSRS